MPGRRKREFGQLKTTTPLITRPRRQPSHFTVEVRCLLKLKAKENDWKPPATMEEMSAKLAANRVDDKGNGKEHGTSDFDGDEEDMLNTNHSLFAKADYLEPLNGTVTLTPPGASGSEYKHIGRDFGEVIRRRMRSCFWDELDQHTEETSKLAFTRFDRYGRLLEEFKTPAFKKGSGIWGDEVDFGDILLIEKFCVNPAYRYQGLGYRLVKAMIEKARTKCETFFAIVQATAFNALVDDECSVTGEKKRVVYSRHEQAAQQFWRSLGFRRVGNTDWFILAGDKNHACHNLAAKDDRDPPEFPKHGVLPQIKAVLKRAGPLQTPHPTSMFRATVFAEEEHTLVNLDESAWKMDIMPLFQSLALDHALWGPLDYVGNTVLHISAMRFDPHFVDRVLNQNPVLRNKRNYRGETPIEVLELEMEEQRTIKSWGMRSKCISDQFTGFSDRNVQTLINIKGLKDPSPDEMAKLRYGCTCGRCTAGFLTPRMRLALLRIAEWKYDALNRDMPSLSNEQWGMSIRRIDGLNFLEPRVLDNLKTNRLMRQGFINLFKHFANTLKNDGVAGMPVPANVMKSVNQPQEKPPYTKLFMAKGGTLSPLAP